MQPCLYVWTCTKYTNYYAIWMMRFYSNSKTMQYCVYIPANVSIIPQNWITCTWSWKKAKLTKSTIQNLRWPTILYLPIGQGMYRFISNFPKLNLSVWTVLHTYFYNWWRNQWSPMLNVKAMQKADATCNHKHIV